MSIVGNEKHINTDVLVLGGGMGGMFAAIKAKEQGVDVTLTDKAYAGKSGATHFSEGDILFFRPELGHKLAEWMDVINKRSEYINNQEWSETVLKDSKDRYDDLVSWGVKFWEIDGKVYVNSGSFIKHDQLWQNVSMINRQYAPTLREKALESGVRIMDKIMICELLKQDGRIVGAIGFHTNNGDLYILKAKATILAMGHFSLKVEPLPLHYATGDGEAMAYRAGAEITGKEFKFGSGGGLRSFKPKQQNPIGSDWKEIDTMDRFPSFRGDGMAVKFQPSLNAEGGFALNAAWEAHCGRAPLFKDLDALSPAQLKWITEQYYERVGRAEPDKIGLEVTKGGKMKFPGLIGLAAIPGGSHGIWPCNTSCATLLPGLYAAGDSCATLACGAGYAGFGFGLNHAMVTGTRAGLGAAEFALRSEKITIDMSELKKLTDSVCTPIERKGGFSPGWVTQALQSLVTPYYIFDIKHDERLRGALSIVKFMNRHLVPLIRACDSHEWRLAHETRNMALSVEMVLRSSLFRTESRGSHFREDYPRRNDPTWLAWVKLKDEQGAMKLYKEPVPEKWWPDLSKPYEERYPMMFPGE